MTVRTEPLWKRASGPPTGNFEYLLGVRMRQVLRDRPPLAACAQHVHEPVDYLAHIHMTLVASALGRRKQRRDVSPLFVRQIAGIAKAASIVTA